MVWGVTAVMYLQIQHEVSNGNVVHRICSDACFTKFRATKGLKTNCCDNCGLYIYNKGLPLEYLFHEGQQKRFCNSTCLNSYKKVCGGSCLGCGGFLWAHRSFAWCGTGNFIKSQVIQIPLVFYC